MKIFFFLSPSIYVIFRNLFFKFSFLHSYLHDSLGFKILTRMCFQLGSFISNKTLRLVTFLFTILLLNIILDPSSLLSDRKGLDMACTSLATSWSKFLFLIKLSLKAQSYSFLFFKVKIFLFFGLIFSSQ